MPSAPSAYQAPKAKLVSAERRGEGGEAPQDRPARERVPERRRGQGHRDRGEQGEEHERGHAQRVIGDRGQQQHAHPGGPAHPVDEADAVGLPGGAPQQLGVTVVVLDVVRVSVEVAMLHRAMAMNVGVEAARAPVQQEPDRQRHDHDADRQLGAPLHAVGQVGAEQHDRQAEGEQRGRVAQPPSEAQAPGAARAALLVGGDQRRDRGEVVGIGGVAQPEEDGDGAHHQRGASVPERGDLLVEPEHQPPLRAAATAAWP